MPTVPKTTTPTTAPTGTAFEKWYMDQLGTTYAGEAWERPEGMSDLEYQKGKTLENAHIAQGRADAKLNQQMGRIEAQRSSALQSAAINNDKLMKYLPAQLKAMGMSNLGVAQSSYVRAANDYASQRGAINQQFNDAASAAWDAYADGQAQRDIQLNQSMTELERYYGEKEEQKAKEAEATAKADQKAADDTFLARIQSVEWNSPEELEAFISDAEAKGSVSEDAIAWARYLQTDYTGDFAKAEEQRTTAESDQTKAQVTASVKSMVNNALAAGRTKESIMAEISAYQGQIDPVVWAEITSAINSGEHLRLTAEEEKAAAESDQTKAQVTASVKSMVNNALNAGRTKESIMAEISAYQGQIDPVVWAEITSAINSGEHLRLTAEEERTAAEDDNAKTELANSLLSRVMGGIKAGYSREQLEGILTGHSAADVGDLAWDEMQELINQAAFMSEEEKAARATEIANENVDFYISNGLYEDDTPEEFFLWMEQNAADADDEVWNRGMDMYRQNAKDQLKAEAERIKAEEDAAAAKAMTTADSMINEIIQTFDGKPDDLDAELKKYMDSASELGREFAEYFRNMYRIGYEEAKEEQSKAETDEKVLEGRQAIEKGGETFVITGEAVDPYEMYEDDFMEAISEFGAISPYDSKFENGDTIYVGRKGKAYTFYEGNWYPSEKLQGNTAASTAKSASAGTISGISAGASGTKFDPDIVNYILNGR